MPLLIAVVLRVVGLAALIATYMLLIPVIWPPGEVSDANIGAGLIGFGILALAAGAWGFVDGTRRPLQQVAVTWLSTSVVLSLGWSVVTMLAEGPFRPSRADVESLVFMVPFTVVLLAGPALVAAAVGSSIPVDRTRSSAGP